MNHMTDRIEPWYMVLTFSHPLILMIRRLKHVLGQQPLRFLVCQVIAETVEEQVSAGTAGELVELLVIDYWQQPGHGSNAVRIGITAAPGGQHGLQRGPIIVDRGQAADQ